VDFKEAFRWYLKAARRGHAYAAHNLARLYETGRGVKLDARRAEFWYKRAGES
jgi:TPR repeat protein